ncbi:MAG: NAD-dependent dehydratase [Acidimicrobiaceae bacterium]|nr:NAD-dependent dehydratase [Acidimicrobiaceae bacterium]|tara:strand:+ start:2847 stop:3815 length:969 start_codon:yes stop_codon:yes gene_type:complete
MRLEGGRFVVVGGAGLIGSHTVDLLLAAGVAEVVVFDNLIRGSTDNLTAALADNRVRIVQGDLRDPSDLDPVLSGVDGVFHFAALWLLHCHENPSEGFEVNVTGSFNLFEACVRHGVERVVFSSSASVYGDAVTEPMAEDHPFANTTVYGATKIAGEALLTSFHHRDGLETVGLRYFNVYGPRQDYKGAYVAVIMKMLDRLDRGEPPVVFGDGTQSYDFVSVRDCARANLAAMEASVVDRYYNVCTGVKTSISEVADHLIRLTGQDVEVQFLPDEASFVRNRIGDPEAAHRDLGFTASAELEDGLRELIAWRAEHQRMGSTA